MDKLHCAPHHLDALHAGCASARPADKDTPIGVVSLVILNFTAVLTVAIDAFIVMVMKGPAYVADAYPPMEAKRSAEADAARAD